MINYKKLDVCTKVKYDEAMDLVKEQIHHILGKSPLIIRDYTKHLLGGQGKNIRAYSVLITAEDSEGMVDPNAITVAAAIEILHLATLVHDDIIDNADIRRGIPTLQKKFGKRTAVICGDYLLSIALNMIAQIPNKKDYLDLKMPDFVGRVCLGELNQHINNTNLDLSIYQYLKIISGKTAALFEASFYGGAIFSGCSENEMNQFKRLGNYIGMIFQLSDDCIDFDTSIEVANKPVQSDFEQGVITLPLIHALKENNELKEKARNSGISRKEINEAVSSTNGLLFTKMVINKYYKKSMKIIDSLEITTSKKDRLVTLLNKASRLA